MLHFSQTMTCRNLFCCWKNQQKWEYKEETSREHKQRVTQKEEIAFPISFRKRYVLENMLQKKESKGEKRATQISLNMQSGSSQSFVQRQINMKKVPNKKVNRQRCFFQICNSSFNLSFREVIDRENKRRKRETNVLETRKNEERKRNNRWTNVWAKGHKEGTHACKKR